MKQLKEVLICAILLAIVALISGCAAFVWTAPAHIDARIESMQAAVIGELDARARSLQSAAIAEIDTQAGDLRGQIDWHLTAIERNVFSRADAAGLMVNQRVGDSLARVDRAIGEVEQVRADLRPTVDHVNSISAHADEASAILLRRDALPAQLLGVTGAAKITLGETAGAMRQIQKATPEFLATTQEIARNLKETTEASTEAAQDTHKVMANFAIATKPLPTWMRIGLAVAPSLSQVAFSIASTLALTGH